MNFLTCGQLRQLAALSLKAFFLKVVCTVGSMTRGANKDQKIRFHPSTEVNSSLVSVSYQTEMLIRLLLS